jgi:hypothetical protein
MQFKFRNGTLPKDGPHFFLQPDLAGCQFTGCSSFVMFGTGRNINSALKAVVMFTVVQIKTVTMVVTVKDPRGPSAPIPTAEVDFSVEQDGAATDGGLEKTAIIIWSSIAVGGLLLIGALFCLAKCVIGRALEGERLALWFVRNILLTHVDPHDKAAMHNEPGSMHGVAALDSAIRSHHRDMSRVQCCSRLLKVLCPCCVKYSIGREDVPSEESMTKDTLRVIENRIASHHLPDPVRGSIKLEVASDEIFDWERHEHKDEATGQVRVYYYNPKTDVSSWEKPKVKVRGS